MTYNLPLWAFEGYVFSIWTLLLDGLDHNKVPYKVKARIQPPLHYPRIEMINILNSWYKSLPIILLP